MATVSSPAPWTNHVAPWCVGGQVPAPPGGWMLLKSERRWIDINLVGGHCNMTFAFPFSWELSSKLTKSYFSGGVEPPTSNSTLWQFVTWLLKTKTSTEQGSSLGFGCHFWTLFMCYMVHAMLALVVLRQMKRAKSHRVLVENPTDPPMWWSTLVGEHRSNPNNTSI